MGTIYLQDIGVIPLSSPGLFSNVIFSGVSNWAGDRLVLSNSLFGLESGFQLTITNDLIIDNGSAIHLGTNAGTLVSVLNCGGDLTLTNGGALFVYSGLTNSTDYGALVSVTGDVFIATNSWVYPTAHGTNGGSPLFLMRNLYVNSGGGINAVSRGYAQTLGDGAGETSGTTGAGGGYGGVGGKAINGVADGGTTYGATNAPFDPGSGAGYYEGGGRGGGLVRVEARESIVLDGDIKANGGGDNASGAGYAAGGASGGSIFLVCEFFSGSGSLAADGGKGQRRYNNEVSYRGGGGGGGRIAVWYDVALHVRQQLLVGHVPASATVTNSCEYFFGTVSVTNGIGWTNLPPDGAECGTIVFITAPAASGTLFSIQ